MDGILCFIVGRYVEISIVRIDDRVNESLAKSRCLAFNEDSRSINKTKATSETASRAADVSRSDRFSVF